MWQAIEVFIRILAGLFMGVGIVVTYWKLTEWSVNWYNNRQERKVEKDWRAIKVDAELRDFRGEVRPALRLHKDLIKGLEERLSTLENKQKGE